MQTLFFYLQLAILLALPQTDKANRSGQWMVLRWRIPRIKILMLCVFVKVVKCVFIYCLII